MQLGYYYGHFEKVSVCIKHSPIALSYTVFGILVLVINIYMLCIVYIC